jgi:hypothetical protein
MMLARMGLKPALHAQAGMQRQRLATSGMGRLLPARAVCTIGPLLRGSGLRSPPPTMLAVRSNVLNAGTSGSSSTSCVVTLPQQGYRSASGTNKLKAKLKAKHRRAKGGANPRGKSQLPKGQRKSRKKPLPGRQ